MCGTDNCESQQQECNTQDCNPEPELRGVCVCVCIKVFVVLAPGCVTICMGYLAFQYVTRLGNGHPLHIHVLQSYTLSPLLQVSNILVAITSHLEVEPLVC